MSTLDITSFPGDTNVLNESDLDNVKDGLETFLNTTKLNSDNIQSGSLDRTRFASGAVTRDNLEAVGEQVSASSSTFTTTNTTYTDITNATVTITTSGRPVVLLLQADGTDAGLVGEDITSGTSAVTNLRLLRASATILAVQILVKTDTSGANTIRLGGGGIFHMDEPIAGTITYKVQIKTFNGTSEAKNLKLSAYEVF